MNSELTRAEGVIWQVRVLEGKRLNKSVKAVPSANTLPLRLAGPPRAPVALWLEQVLRGGGLAASFLRGAGGPQEPRDLSFLTGSMRISLHIVILLKDLCSRQVAPLPALGIWSAQFPLPGQPVSQGPTFTVVTK